MALVLSRDGSPVAAEELAGVAAALDHRGVDGRRTLERQGIRLAHQHFWTTPEEVGERQPIEDLTRDCDLLFDGRLDNREELLADLGAGDTPLSDARLMLAAWQFWGESCFHRLLGPFAVLIRDGFGQRIVAARDPLGDRTLFYSLTRRRAIIASEEGAVLRHPQISPRLDEQSLARYFAIDTPRPGATFFAEVRELPPGHQLVLDHRTSELRRFWTAPLERHHRFASDSEHVEHLGDLLRASVGCRLRAVSTPAILMSGGLDSTSIAALASAQLPAEAGPLRTISWTFASLPEADESHYIEAMTKRYGFAASLLPGDDAWPLRNLEPWRTAINRPQEGPFRILAQEGYRQARAQGGRVLLTGEYGDHLFSGGAYWLRDLLEEDRTAEAALGVLRSLGRQAAGPSLRSVLARALGIPARRPRDRPWLTARARTLLEDDGGAKRTVHSRPEQLELVLGARAARGASGEVSEASRAGIDVRQPFRDRRLVEFMLCVPAHLLFRPPWNKWLLRQAMRSTLPPTVRLRLHRSSLRALFVKGVLDRERPTVQRLLWDSPRIWPRFVRSDWLLEKYPRLLQEGHEGKGSLVVWYCLAAELWQRGSAEF